jgi:plasmid maintenance system antidote protein VapI
MGYRFNTNKVRGLMAENNISHIGFARIIGVTDRTLRNKLNGQFDFTAKEICDIAETFNVNPSIFFIQEIKNNAIDIGI